jgi:predicted nucleic acid-binding protein
MRGHAEVKLVLQGAEEIHLTPVVLGELLAGFFKGKNRRKNERELQAFLESPRVNVANVDSETARRYAVIVNTLLTAGTPIPTNDVWIAASAMQHGLRVTTTDAHFSKIPQVLTDYFEP